MVIILILLAGVCFFIARYLHHKANETTDKVQQYGGMKAKYKVLLDNILSQRKDAKIFVCTKTYIKVGVSSYGGNTFFHIQQCPGNQVIIDYEISNNPIFPDYTIRKIFQDNMDQQQMLEELCLEIAKHIKSI